MVQASGSESLIRVNFIIMKMNKLMIESATNPFFWHYATEYQLVSYQSFGYVL